jgi:hypothetical protein
MIVHIFDVNGQRVDGIEIDDTLTYVNGRVSKGEKHYYKGAGMPYACHILPPNPNMDGYTAIEDPGIFYLGPVVQKHCFMNKTGIFQEIYQPQFTDFIGSCGVKELSIIENSMEFEKSSPYIHKAVNYDTVNGQYYFIMDYKCGRVKYLKNGNPKDLLDLLEYMIASNWNFVWDKQSIEDISYNGLVTDVGDIFYSKELMSKIGTVYSVIYSLGIIDHARYQELIKLAGLAHGSRMSYVFNTLKLLNKFGVQTKWNHDIEAYKDIVMNYLVVGRNCGDCCFISVGDEIRERYIAQTRQQLKL